MNQHPAGAADGASWPFDGESAGWLAAGPLQLGRDLPGRRADVMFDGIGDGHKRGANKKSPTESNYAQLFQ
jgi:hypothetical protein